MASSEERRADMDAWGLNIEQRIHHLARLSDYYTSLGERTQLARHRIQRIERAAALCMLVWFAVAMLLLWAIA